MKSNKPTTNKKIDIEKLKSLIWEEGPRDHPHCAGCKSEVIYCSVHQKAEAYLAQCHDVLSPAWLELYDKYIMR